MSRPEAEFEVIDQYGERHRFKLGAGYWWAWRPKSGTIDTPDTEFLDVFKRFEEDEDEDGEGTELFATSALSLRSVRVDANVRHGVTMTTAQEIELKVAEIRPKIEAIAHGFETMLRDLVTYGTHVAIGREVCARRARKLRKRSEDVRYVGRTKTGKARYSWMRRIAPWAIYMPNGGSEPTERR